MTKKGPVLLVDLGSASVGIAIAESNASGVPVISQVRRIPFENASGASTAALATVALDALKKGITAIAPASAVPKTAEIVLAAPWYKAVVSVIASGTEKPARISEATIEKALAQYREQNRRSSLPGRTIIESAATERYIDGYPTTVAKPLTGSTLAVDYYESEADTPFLAAIEEALRRVFPGIESRFHSFLFAAFAVLRATRDETGFILLDIGGEITDIALVRRGGFSFVGSFPYGALSFQRDVAGGRTLADAASRATLYTADELSTEERDSFAGVFKKAAAGWSEGYDALLSEAALVAAVPHTTFLIADKEPAHWFEHVLADSDAPFPVHPIIVTPDFFKNIILLGTDGAYDAFLSIAAIYAFQIRH